MKPVYCVWIPIESNLSFDKLQAEVVRINKFKKKNENWINAMKIIVITETEVMKLQIPSFCNYLICFFNCDDLFCIYHGLFVISWFKYMK